jgi:opacity protein-like surface antigen
MRSENPLMKKLTLASAALASVSIPAFAADMPIKPPGVAVPAFAWSGCFLGAHAGARQDPQPGGQFGCDSEKLRQGSGLCQPD